MRIVIDTNIAFSAILNTDRKIARVILQPKTPFNFYSTENLLIEIEQHKDKIKILSGYADHELNRVIKLITNKIRFINVRLIPEELYNKAELLASDIDIDDTEFIALTDHIRGKLWSGDKELQKGLVKKNWNKFITTEELYKRLTKRK